MTVISSLARAATPLGVAVVCLLALAAGEAEAQIPTNTQSPLNIDAFPEIAVDPNGGDIGDWFSPNGADVEWNLYELRGTFTSCPAASDIEPTTSMREAPPLGMTLRDGAGHRWVPAVTKPPFMPPPGISFYSHATETVPSKDLQIVWRPSMALFAVKTNETRHCMLLEAYDTQSTWIDIFEISVTPYGNNPTGGLPITVLKPIHGMVATESGNAPADGKPTATRFFAQNVNLQQPVLANDILSLLTCPGGTSCAIPPWVGFYADDLKVFVTFDPSWGARGDYEFQVDLSNFNGPTNPETFQLRVFPAQRARPQIEPALWSAGFGGPHFVPLDRFDVESEPENDNPLTAPYIDRGFMAGELPTASDRDHFSFFVGGVAAHELELTNRNGSRCPFDATLTLFRVEDGVVSPALASSSGNAGPQSGCARIPPTVLDEGSTYVVQVRPDGANGYGYVLRHRVFHDELEEMKNAPTPAGLVVDDIFAPGLVGQFRTAADHDWVKVHLPPGDALDIQLDDLDDKTCLKKGEIEVLAFNGTTFTSVLGGTVAETVCPELTALRYARNGVPLEATMYIRVRGEPGPYMLRVDRHLTGFGGNTVEWRPELLDVDDAGISPGTCSGVRAVILDDYSANGEFFALYEAPDANATCDGSDPDVMLDAYGVCRHIGQGFGDASNLWHILPTDFGTVAYTMAVNAPPVHVVSMGANQLYGDGAAAGTIGGRPSVLKVSEGSVGNHFYYDPYGECDVQTYPSEQCKGNNPELVVKGALPSCKITQGAYVEGQLVEFHMTRWNQGTIVNVARCKDELGTSCQEPLPPGIGYDLATDIFSWDIPFGVLGKPEERFVFRLTAATPAGGLASSYLFAFNVRQRPSVRSGVDTFVSALRKDKPLAFVKGDSRIFQQAFESSALAKQKHAADLSYWQFATSIDTSRTLGVNDRVQLHPQFEAGRVGDGSGRTRFELVVKNGGDTDSKPAEVSVFVARAEANNLGQLAADAPSGSPLALLALPAIVAGGSTELKIDVDSRRLLSASGNEPWIAGARALWFVIKAGDDVEPKNNVFGPVFVSPTRPPRACADCTGTDTPGYSGAYSATKDVTGVIASVTPEQPASGDLVEVNVQMQFSGSGWSSASKLRFYQDQPLAPTDLDVESKQDSFPELPKSGTLYGYSYSFVAEKPGGDNTLHLRALLDATNEVTEPGSGESNNQLPSNANAYPIEIANSAPVFQTAAVTTATEDVAYQYEVRVSDADDVDLDRLGLTVDGPEGLAFTGALATCVSQPTSKCRTLSWLPNDADAIVGAHPVTLTVCDGDAVAGGAGSCTDQAFVIDVTPVDDEPEITSGAPATVATEDVPYSHTITASDEESATLTFLGTLLPAGMSLTTLSPTSAQVTWTPSDAGVGTKGVTVTVQDGTGGVVDVSWSVTTANVNDDPVLSAPSDVSADEGSAYSASLSISDVDNSIAGQGQTHSCSKVSPTPAWVTVSKVGASCAVSGTPANVDTGVVTVAVQLADSADGTTTREYALTVTDVINGNPALAATDNQAADQGDAIALLITASDDDLASPGYSEDLTYTLEQGPSGAILTDNGASVTFTWTPENADVGDVPVTLRATDVRGAYDDESFTITVSNVNDAPTLVPPADAAISEGGAYAVSLSASDPDSVHGDTLTYSVVGGAPPGFSVNATTGLMQLSSVNDAQVGSWEVTVRAQDASLASDQETFTLTVTNVAESPSLPPLADAATAEDALYTRVVSASDPDPGAVLTYSLVTPPAGMTIGGGSGVLSWTPPDADVGPHTVTVKVVDETLRESSASFTLTVNNTNDTPSFTSAPDVTAVEEESYSYIASAIDADSDSGDTLTWSAPVLPSWLSFNGVTRALTSNGDRPDDEDVGDHLVTLRVTDSSAAFVEQSFTITVSAVNDAPTLETIAGLAVGAEDIELSVSEGETLSFSLVGSDVDDEAVALGYEIDSDPVSFAELSVDASTGLVTFTPTFDEAGEYALFARVIDDDLAYDEVPFQIVVLDVNRAPVFSTAPTTTTAEDALWSYDANANDADGETVSYSLSAGPTDMSVDASTGLASWTPGNEDVGGQLVTLRASDGVGGTTDQSFTLTVTNQNDQPVFTSAPTTAATEEDAYSYLAAASDADGDSLTYSAVTLPAWLTFTPATRTLSGTPDDGDLDDGDVSLRVVDGNGGVATQAFTIVIAVVNDAPTLVAPTPSGTLAGAEGSAYSFSIAATDPDNATLSYSIDGAPTGSSLDASTGAFSWTPGYTQAGSYALTLRASDGSLQATQALTLNVANTDRAPLVNAGPDIDVDEGTTLSITVSYSDPDGEATSLALTQGPAGASLTGGTLTWVPAFDDAGEHTLLFTATAGALSTEDTVIVTVNHVNQAPTLAAPAEGQTATENTPYTLDLSASDLDLANGDTLTFSKQAGPAGLTVADTDASSGRLSWTPADDDVGVTSVTVRVTDGSGAYDEQTFALTVANVNDAPAITSSALTAATEDVVYSYTLTASDADLAYGDALTLSAPALPGWLSFDPLSGVLSGTPSNDQVGSHDVVLRATDSALVSVEQAFTVVVSNVNDAPSIDPVPDQSVAELATLSFTVIARDVDGTLPTLTLDALPAGASFVLAIVGDTRVGTFEWTPTDTDEGSYPLIFTASDGSATDTESVVISVGDVNRPPALAPIGARDVAEASTLSFTVSATDPDVEDTVTLSAVGGDNDPFLRGAVFNAVTGAFSWTPGYDDAGSYSATFTATDDKGASHSEVVSITVANTNRAPAFVSPPTPSGSLAAAEGSAIGLTVSASDPDGEAVSYTAAPLPAGATFSGGAFAWTPGYAQVGSYPITLGASDGSASVTRDIVIEVSNTDRAPTLSAPSSRATSEGANLSFIVTGADADGDTVTLSMLSGPSGATFTGGSFQWTPSYVQQGTATATFRASANGKVAEASTTITVAQVNLAPTLGAPDDVTATQDLAWSATLGASDDDIGSGVAETLSFSLLSGPSGAAVSKTSETTANVTWTPSAADVNPGVESFTVRVTDAGGLLADRIFEVSVANVNDAPVVAAIDDATIAEGSAFVLTASAADADVDAGLTDPITWSLTAAPSGMSIDSAGVVRWTPGDDSVGTANVTVRAQDVAGASDDETFVLTVTNTPDAPVFTTAPTTTASEGASYSYTAAASDADQPSGDTLTLSADVLPSWLSFNATTGLLSGTPANDDVGAHPVTLRVTDSTARSAQQSFTVTVTNVDDAPVFASIDDQSAAEGALLSFAVSASDPDGQPVTISYSSVDLPAAATFDGTSFTWTPGFGDAGSYTASFEASDGTRTATLEVAIVVGETNRAPVLAAVGARSVSEGASLSIVLSASDPDADTLSYSAVGVVGADPFASGASFDAASRTFSWTPGFDDAGVYQIDVAASDGSLSDGERVSLTVTDANRAPAFTATPPTSVNEDATLAYLASATDPDGDTLQWTLTTGPAGAALAQDTGALSWTPDNSAVGEHAFEIAISDGRGGSATQPFTLTVNNSNDAPLFTTVPLTTATEEEPYAYVAAASDVDVGATLTWSAPTLPGWLSFNASDRTLTGTPDDTEVGSHEVVLRVTDDAGAVVEQAFTVAVTAVNDAPVFAEPTPSGPLSVAEGDSLTFVIAATDAEGTAPAYDVIGLPADATIDSATGAFTWPTDFADAGTRQLTLVADDGSASATRAITVTVTNTDRPPVLSAPATANGTESVLLSFSVDGDDPDGEDVTLALDSGPAGASFDPLTGLFRWTPSYEEAGSFSAVFSASAGGATTTATTSITIADNNRAPVVTSVPPSSATEDTLLQYTVTASDDDGDPLTFLYVSGPANASFDAGTGVLSWTPTGAQAGARNFNIRVSDGRNGVVDHTFTVTVGVVNDAPVLTSTPPTDASEDASYSYDANASDEDGDALSYTLSVAPPGMTINASTGEVSWLPGNDQVGSADVTLSVSDGTASVTQSWTVAVANVNDPPRFDDTPPLTGTPPRVLVQEGSTFSWTPSISDVDAGDSTTLALTLAPGGMTLTNGVISWTPGNDDVGFHTVRVRITDAAGASTSYELTIEVLNSNDLPYFVSAPIDATVAEEDALVETVLADDPDVDDLLVFSLVGAPAGVAIDADFGTLSFAPDDAEVGTHTFTVRVTDEAGDFVEQTATIVVTPVNDAPVLTAIANQQVDVGEPLVITLQANDPDGPSLSYALVAGPAGMTVSGSTLSYTAAADDEGSYEVRVSVSDGSLGDEKVFSLVVGDGLLPPDLTLPADRTVDEGSLVTAFVTASDPGGGSVTLAAADLPTGATFDAALGVFEWAPTFSQAGVYDVTFSATAAGGTTARAWRLTVRHVNRAPQFAASNVALADATETLPYSEEVTAADLDGDALSYTLLAGPSGLTLSASGQLQWTPDFGHLGAQSIDVLVSDGNGGQDEATFLIDVYPLDVDADGLPDTWENANGLDPTVDDAALDPDDDGLTNVRELELGTDPFVSDAPSVPTLIAPLANERVASARPTLTFNSSTDPNGFALSYTAIVQDPVTGIEAFRAEGLTDGSGPVAVAVDVDLTEGGSYQWWVRAENDEGGRAESVRRLFVVDAVNLAPPAPTLVAPADGSSVATSQPTLRAAPVVDADGDPVSYLFALRATIDGPAELMSEAISYSGSGDVVFQVSDLLADDSVWFWDVRARDGRGLTGAASETRRFTVDLDNLPPPTPSLLGPALDEIVSVKPFSLIVAAVADPEGLPVTYRFELSRSPSYVDGEIFESQAVADGAAAVIVADAFVGDHPDGLYYWRASASDGATASDFVEGRFDLQVTNDAPSAPALLAPADNSLVTGTSVTLRATTSDDPEGDPLSYAFELTDVAGEEVLESAAAVDDDADGEIEAAFSGLTPGVRYGWRASADDGVTEVPSALFTFRVEATNERPSAPALLEPADGAELTSASPTFRFAAAVDPEGDAVTHDLEIEVDGSVVFQASSLAATGGEVSVTPGVPLPEGDGVWRARGRDAIGGGAWSERWFTRVGGIVVEEDAGPAPEDAGPSEEDDAGAGDRDAGPDVIDPTDGGSRPYVPPGERVIDVGGPPTELGLSCGCSSGGSLADAGLGVALFALFGLLRRRRAARKRD